MNDTGNSFDGKCMRSESQNAQFPKYVYIKLKFFVLTHKIAKMKSIINLMERIGYNFNLT